MADLTDPSRPSLVSQPSGMPTRKVMAGGLGGAVVIVGAYILREAAGVTLPQEVTAALTTIVTFAFSYLARERAPR